MTTKETRSKVKQFMEVFYRKRLSGQNLNDLRFTEPASRPSYMTYSLRFLKFERRMH